MESSSPLIVRSSEDGEKSSPDTTSLLGQVWDKSWEESKRLWFLAAPAILTTVFQYSFMAVTQTFAGHIGPVQLAAVSIQNLAISGIGFGAMTGMGSALETLSGQAFGAGQLYMLGIYMQRSWLILLCTAVVMSLIYIFATPILILLRQNHEIARVAGKFSLWMLPQLFSFAINSPMQKFLQSQSKVYAMAWISGAVLLLHVFLSWLCIIKLGWGLVGAAVTLNLAWWLVVLGQFVYIVAGACPGAWTGFSWLAFRDLGGFVKLSLASAVMLWLEYWFIMILLILIGALKDPEIALDAASICLNLDGWFFMITLGFMAAISVRVANELGAGQPRAAQFAVVIAVLTSLAIGIIVMLVIVLTRKQYPVLFTNDDDVRAEVARLSGLLGASIVLNSVQPVLSGVAVGAGWQALISYINIGCYFLVGLTSGMLMGYKLNLREKGLWGGILLGILVQAIILAGITFWTDWKKEASLAKERVCRWGASAAEPNAE